MVTVCLVIFGLAFIIDLMVNWDNTDRDSQNARIFHCVSVVLVIFAITALNNGFTFPTDFQEIRRRSLEKKE